MTVYLDLVFFLNLWFDFLLLLTVSNTLKRNASLKRLFLGACLGSLSYFTLFIPLSTCFLFLLKILLAFLMCTLTFGIKDKTYTIQNVSYFYMTSVVLGGFLYFLSLQFSESHEGLLFTYQEYSIPYLFLIIFSPVMLYVYYRQRKDAKKYMQHYQIKITFLNGKTKEFSSFLDTGNHLQDPITKKYVILVRESLLKGVDLSKVLYVPYHSLNHQGVMRCIKIDSIALNEKESKNYLVGISEGDLLRDGIDCVLNSYCLEELL